jgi:hypothetical protein
MTVRDPMVAMAAALAAAISLLEKGGKKAAPSDRMFEHMLADYRLALEKGRAAFAISGKEDKLREMQATRLDRIRDDGGPLTLSDKAILREIAQMLRADIAA